MIVETPIRNETVEGHVASHEVAAGLGHAPDYAKLARAKEDLWFANPKNRAELLAISEAEKKRTER